MTNETRVQYEESLHIRVTRFLDGKGFDFIADDAGTALCILWKDPDAPPGEILFFSRLQSVPRRILGIIWFENEKPPADKDHWVIVVYGREHVERLTRLAEEAADAFGVAITVRLESEDAGFEKPCRQYYS